MFTKGEVKGDCDKDRLRNTDREEVKNDWGKDILGYTGEKSRK